MNNPAYKTDRERRNVKDVLGLRAEGKEKETGMAVALEMTSLFAGSLMESRQPLLKEETGGGVTGQDGKGRSMQNGPGERQNQESIFAAVLKNGSNNGAQSGAGNEGNGGNGGNVGNQQGLNTLLEDLSGGRKQETGPSPIGKESWEIGMTPISGNVKDPR
jgi:hypothetical protein